MKTIVPYTKEIIFKTKIAEITSISLEHELNIVDQEINGNFIVCGEYRTHEVSVNKEPFSYKLPFTLEVTENVIKDSIDFEITDFAYEVENDSILKVDIEFCVTAEEGEMMEEQEDKEEIREAVIEEINELFESEETKERLDNVSESIILNSASEKESEFATYHIHIVTNTDTLESICDTYKTDIDTLKEYNNIDTIGVGEKLVIPYLDE